jgi:predicted nucleic acid-binding protein
MLARDFLDSNILVNACDVSDSRKQRLAQDLVRKAIAGECLMSVQFLAEFAATLLHKLSSPVPPDDVLVVLNAWGPIRLVAPDGDIVRRAVEARASYGLLFYDGMRSLDCIDGKAWAPRITSPAVRIIRFSGKAPQYEIQQRQIAGGKIRVYSPAKTVADCFKFCNKIGAEVALEALRDCYRQKKATTNEFFEAAKVCRVANVMRPYLESLR